MSGDREPTAGRLLVRAVRRTPFWSGLLVFAAVGGAGARLLFPAALADAVNAILGDGGSGVAFARVTAVLGAVVLTDLLTRLAGACYGTVVTVWLRGWLFGHVLRLGVSGQRRFGTGDVTARMTGDASGAGGVLPALLSGVAAAVMSVGAVVGLWRIDWRLAAVFLVGLPPTVLLMRIFMARASELFVDYRRIQTGIVARLVDALAGMRTIRASGNADREVDRVLVPLAELGVTGRGLWATQRQASWQVGLLVPALEIVVLAMAGLGVVAGRIKPGGLLAAVGYTQIALGAFDQIDSLVGVVYARAAAARVAEVLAMPAPAVAAVRSGRGLRRGGGGLEFRNVTVRAGETMVLDQVNLVVPGGVGLAVVGRSGSGKTTLALLAGRLLDPDEGQVLLDGVPLAALALWELRAAVAYAFERPALVGGTIGEAIAFGRPGLSRSQVEAAARTAQADGFIRRLPSGYDTPVAAAPLSGGEAQRIGLARAIARGGRLLILDDATSSLDTATEAQFETALAGLLVGRTCVVVAHRAATAARADLAAWLDGGRVRRLAPHAQLWADPDYRAVFAANSVSAANPSAAEAEAEADKGEVGSRVGAASRWE
ncbi:MAG: ABC transporter ATP-binding protein [Egibacteraceae bacterium]